MKILMNRHRVGFQQNEELHILKESLINTRIAYMLTGWWERIIFALLKTYLHPKLHCSQIQSVNTFGRMVLPSSFICGIPDDDWTTLYGYDDGFSPSVLATDDIRGLQIYNFVSILSFEIPCLWMRRTPFVFCLGKKAWISLPLAYSLTSSLCCLLGFVADLMCWS